MAAAAVQWRILAEVGDTLSRGLDAGNTWGQVTRLLVPETADCCVLYLASDNDSPERLEVAHIESARADDVRDALHALLSETGSARLLHQLCVDLTYRAQARSLLARLGLPGGAVAPVRVGRRPRGLLLLAFGNLGLCDREDAEFVRALADRIGVELEGAIARRQSARAVAASELAVGIVSHDLGNPLATIQICTNALLGPEPQPAESVHEIAEILQRSTAWMRQIIRDLLDRVSLDAGPLPIAREPTAVSDLVETMRAMFQPLAKEQGLQFAIDCAANLPQVDADPHRLQQVLSNLLGNAMKFTPAGGRVTLSAHLAGKQGQGAGVRFSVGDSGPGIPAQDLPHVFDWFWHSQAGKRSNTGLGLAIAKGVIEAHGARLMVESALGRGSNFWFTLPTWERVRAMEPRALEFDPPDVGKTTLSPSALPDIVRRRQSQA